MLADDPGLRREILPGAAVAAVGWAILQLVGGYFVSHQIEGASAAYGTFALVIGLLAWVHLGAMLTILCAELNAVRAKAFGLEACFPSRPGSPRSGHLAGIGHTVFLVETKRKAR